VSRRRSIVPRTHRSSLVRAESLVRVTLRTPRARRRRSMASENRKRHRRCTHPRRKRTGHRGKSMSPPRHGRNRRKHRLDANRERSRCTLRSGKPRCVRRPAAWGAVEESKSNTTLSAWVTGGQFGSSSPHAAISNPAGTSMRTPRPKPSRQPPRARPSTVDPSPIDLRGATSTPNRVSALVGVRRKTELGRRDRGHSRIRPRPRVRNDSRTT
jgi:hypothetical protein